MLAAISSPVLFAQPSTQDEWDWRGELATALNGKVDLIQSGIYSLQTVALNQSGFGTISIKDVEGGCTTVNGNGNIEIVYDPEVSEENFTFRFPLKSQTVIDVPVESHRLPCQLNNGWLFHMWKGRVEERHDTGIDAYNFDVNCGSNTTQVHFMDDIGSGSQWLPQMWSSNFSFNVRVMDGSTERGYLIHPHPEAANAELIYMVGGTEVLARRNFTPNPHWTYFLRSDVKVAFDYTKTPLQGCIGCEYVPHPDIYWADVDNVNGNASGSELRLEAIQFIGQYRTPESDACGNTPTLTNPGYMAYDARMTLRVHYRDGTGTALSQDVVIKKEGTPASEANEWLWDLRRLDGYRYLEYFEFAVDEDGFMYLQISDDLLWLDENFRNAKLYANRIHTDVSPAEYCELVLPIGGTFAVDGMDGKLKYFTSPSCTLSACPSLPISCIDYCYPISGKRTIDNVIAAAASTLSSEWTYDPRLVGMWITSTNENVFVGANTNRYQRGQDGRWRLDRSFVYKSAIKQADPGTIEVFDDAGVFVDESGNTAGAFVLYDWHNQESNAATAWLTSTIVTQYAPSGAAIEEKNVLEIYSAAKLAHEQVVANATAANARYDAIGFESFEEHDVAVPGHPFADDITDDYAHTGRRSYALDPGGEASDPLDSFVVSTQTIAPGGGSTEKKGVLVKFWIKQEYDDDPPANEAPFNVIIGEDPAVSALSDEDLGTYQPGTIVRVAQTGEWTLYQFIKDDFTETDDGETITIALSSNLPSTSPVWVDDIRVQPLDAQMTCNVYDPNTLRLVAQFDDQHFAAFYQYNGEGKLVRTLRETESGIMTVAETQYHSYNTQRHTFTPASSIGTPTVPLSTLNGSAAATSSTQTNIDLFDFRIGPEGVSYETLSNLDSVLADLDRTTPELDLDNAGLEELQALVPDLDIAEKMKYLEELRHLDSTKRELAEQAHDDLDAAGRKKLEDALKAIDKQRKELLAEKLGLTEEEVKALYKALGKSEDDDDNPTEE